MNRRQFIATLSAAAAATALAPLENLAPIEREAWLNEVLLAGDVFTIEGIYSRNPITGQATTFLQNFIITNVVSDDTIDLHPSLPDGARRMHRRHVMPLGTRT